jgi:glycosyltransferase involved in cell wall biosynthesis
MKRPVALLLAPIRPDAQGNGLARRAWMWAATLAARHELQTIVLAKDQWFAQGRGDVPGTTNIIPVRSSATRPDWIVADPELVQVLRDALPADMPDRIVVFRLQLLDVLALLPPAWRHRVELDSDDREAHARLDFARLSFRRFRLRAALGHLRGALCYVRAERRAIRQVSSLHLAAAEDADAVRRLAGPGLRVFATPNRIDGPLAPPRAEGSVLPPRILFVGTLGFLPNEDAALWLAEAITPHLRRLVPNAQVTVAGLPGSARLAATLARAGVEYLGAPESLSEAYANAAVAIAPLRGGSGTKLKVLEAWQHGRPVVATSHACRGLGAVPGQDVLRADSAAGLAAACARVLIDGALAVRLAANGQALLRRRFHMDSPERA